MFLTLINLLLLNIGGHIFEVYGLQEFYRQPENITATQGATVYLKCIIKNKGAGEVQWTKGGFGLGFGTSLLPYERHSVISQSKILPSGYELEETRLKIIDLSIFDDDYYQCQVPATKDSWGLVSDRTYINVLVPPKQPLLLGGPTISVEMNEPSNITCLALNGKPKSEIIWKIDGVRVTQNTYEISTTQPASKLVNTAGTITIIAELSDAGMRLECGAWNEAMGEEQPYWIQASLDVLYKPKVAMTHNSSSGVIREFDDIEFTCTAEANPIEIHWKWFLNQMELYDLRRNTLLIQNIPRDYHGSTISCQATNIIGSSTVEYSINISYGPRFIMDPSNVSVEIGQRAELRCVAEGNPRPEIIWRKSAQFHVLHVGPTFVIPSVGEEDFGIYICTATVLGFSEVSQDVYLTNNDALLDERQQIDGNRVPTKVWLESADDTITVHWTPPVNVDDVSFCTISYKANTNPVEVRIPISKVQRMYVITGLNRSTLYNVRLYCLYGSTAGPSTEWFGAATRTVSFEPSVCTGSLPNAVLEPYCLEHPSFGWCKFSCQDGYRRLEVPAAIHNRRSRVEDYAVFLTLLTCSNGTWVTWYEDRAYGINDLCLPEAEFQRCPISIPNGVLEPHCGPATDWLCKFECNSGYHKHIYMSGKLKGVHDDPYMLYCEHGVWKTGYEALGVDVSGVCYAEDHECTSSDGIQNGRITHLPCPSGVTCNFECDPGFHRHALAWDYPACIDGVWTLRTTKYDPSVTPQTLCVSDDSVGVCPPTIPNGHIADPNCTVNCSPDCNHHYHVPYENGPTSLSCEGGKWITGEAAYNGDNICFPECCCANSHNNGPQDPRRNESTAAPPSDVFFYCFPEGKGGHFCPILIPNGISTKDVYQRMDDGHTRRRVLFECNEGFRKHRSVPYIECIAGNWVTAQERFGLDISSVCVPNNSYYI